MLSEFVKFGIKSGVDLPHEVTYNLFKDYMCSSVGLMIITPQASERNLTEIQTHLLTFSFGQSWGRTEL